MIEIKPLKELDAEIKIPGSKYIANRVLVLASLANGKSVIRNIPKNDDITQMIRVLKELGVKIEENNDSLVIQGCNGKFNPVVNEIDVAESGTLFRFITSIIGLSGIKVEITGSERIKQRPINELLNSLQDLGINFSSNNGLAPIQFESGELIGGETSIPGNVSSQFISSLLMVAPFAKNDVKINVTDELLSRNYIDVTIDMMKLFNVKVINENYKSFIVKSGQSYNAIDYSIPADWSSASYFFAAAAILPGAVKVEGLDIYSSQGEAKFCDLLVKMGCMYRRNNDYIQVIGMPVMSGIEVDMSNMPDVVQTIAVVASFCKGRTVISNIGHLSLKESDRIKDTATELRKIGVNVEHTKDSLTIHGGTPVSGIIDPHNDHRMAMSFAIAGLKVGMKISNEKCVNKSFPGFWDKLRELGAEIIES